MEFDLKSHLILFTHWGYELEFDLKSYLCLLTHWGYELAFHQKRLGWSFSSETLWRSLPSGCPGRGRAFIMQPEKPPPLYILKVYTL